MTEVNSRPFMSSGMARCVRTQTTTYLHGVAKRIGVGLIVRAQNVAAYSLD